jgi:stage V sporulation protein B
MNNFSDKKGDSFAKGAFIITLGMLAVKFFGAIFKIPLMSILGGEGSAYFVGAYNFYSPIYALSTAGLPIAISKLVAENAALGRFRDVRKIRKVSIPIFLVTGTIGFLLVAIGSFIYAKVSKAPDAVYSVIMLAPALLFSCLMSSHRGYYEGLRNMTPTAVSEVIESLGKIIFGLSLSYLTIWLGSREYQKKGTIFGVHYENIVQAKGKILAFASAAAILGVAISAAVAFLYISMRYKIKGDSITNEELANAPRPKRFRDILREIIKISLPVGFGAIVMNLAGVIDSVLIQRRLAHVVANSLDKLKNIYGALIPQEALIRNNVHLFLSGCFGFTSTIAMFLPTIAMGLAVSTLPSVTTAWTLGDKKNIRKSIEKILKITSIISIPMGFGISSLALPILDLIYNTLHSGEHVGEIFIGSQIMTVSGIGAIFIAFSMPICSMLQAIGRADLPLKILSVGVLIKIFLNYILVGIPEINIQGAAVGTLVCYIFVFTLSLIALCRNTKIKINFMSIFIKPCVAGIVCAFSANLFYKILYKIINLKLTTILSIILSAIVYFIMIFLLKIITKQELESDRRTKKFSKIFKKLKFM